jgi:hypothetical protein
MLDYAAVRAKKISLNELVSGLGAADLRRELTEMYDAFDNLIRDCSDEDVVFQPVDPNAKDPYAQGEEADLAWTLGHVIVHLTASAEESAALSAELARGVEFHGRSRWETDWKTITTIAQCHQRMAESRRMCLAGLEMWPDTPDLENSYVPWEGAKPMNAVTRYAGGLLHAWDHLGQVEEIVRQARQAPAL